LLIFFGFEHQACGHSNTDPCGFCTHRRLSASADHHGTDEDFVSTSQKDGQLSVSQAWRIVSAQADEANVSKKVSPHTWRHSIATQLLDAGAPLHKVSSFLGHSDPKITVKAYYSESEGLKVEDFIDIE